MRDMLKEFGVETKQRTGKAILEATEYMDDGSPIKLTVSIDETKVKMIITHAGYKFCFEVNLLDPKSNLP